jgi:flagellar biosynthesis chaperone FliJ
VEEMREKWMEKYNRKRSLERAREKFSQSELMQETKLAQKIQDDHAGRVKKKPWG